MSSSGSSAYTSSPSASLQTQRQPAPPTSQANPRSASGSLDRFASRPVSHVVLKQESSSDFELTDVANASISKAALQPSPHGDTRSPKAPAASHSNSSNGRIHGQNASVSPNRRSALLAEQARPSALQSPPLASASGLPSTSEAAPTTPQQTPKAGNVPPTQSPRMTATTRSPQRSQSRSQASKPTSAPHSPRRQASRNGHQTQAQPSPVLPVPLTNTASLNTASAQSGTPLASQRPRVMQAVVSANGSRVNPATTEKQQAQSSATAAPRSRGPATIPNAPSKAAAQPASSLNGTSALDASKQTTAIPAPQNAASSSNPANGLAETGSPAAIPSNNAFDPQTLLGLRGSFLTSSEPVDYESLVNDNGKFKPVSAISCLEISEEELEVLIIAIVEQQGEPLVISDLDKCPAWSSDLFTPQRYESLRPSVEADRETVLVRNLTDWTDQALPLHDFMARCDKQRSYPPEQAEKLYGKDLPCPLEWNQALSKLVHPRLAYHGEQDASASLRPKARSVTQMCYYGPGHTCTPLHRDLCSSLGQNLMVWSDPDASALWMITHPDDAEAVDRYVASKGGDPYSEGYAPHPNELRDAPFPISCWKQRVGDLVLIPPRASHMVVNTGGRTLKAAWSRLTIDTLTSALINDLPLYQRVCRVESYHIKPVIEESLVAYTKQVEADLERNREISSVAVRDLRGLLKLYDAILSDMFVPEWRDVKMEGGYDSYVECDFCGADVLHGYFECPEGETLCPLCYCQGRLCSCANALEALQPRQHWRSFGERLQFRNNAAQVLLLADPSLALPIKDRPNEADDDADQDPPLLPVEVLKEEDVGKGTWPFSFMAAMNLYKLRQTAGWQDNVAPCKICKANVDLSQRYHCKPCNHSYCHGCLLHKLYIHPAHTLAQNEPKQFHGYHKRLSTLDYKEWKQDPLEFCDEARAHFALIEAARTKMKCGPINESCRIGFLDITDKYPHGLTGTLDVKRPAKAQVEKVKTATAPASSSPPSTPGSRKRPKDLKEPTSASSPRSRSNKRARLDPPPTIPQPMQQDEIAVQMPRTPEAIDVPAITPVLLQLPQPPLSGAAAVGASASVGTEQSGTSIPTVANGIRKFVLREGKIHPVPPVVASQRAAPFPSASPSLTPSTAPRTSPTKSTMVESPLTSGSASPVTAHTVQTTPPVLAGSTSTASVPSAPSIVRVPRQSTSKSPPVSTTLNGISSPASVSAPAPNPMVAPGAVPAASPAASAPRTVSPPSVAAAQPTAEQGTLALATSVVAAGITSSPKAPATGSPPDGTTAGLGSLDSMNLRVVTEILRIFSQSNQRMIQTQLGEISAAMAKQAEEHKKQQAKQDDNHRKALAKMEATLLQKLDQQSSQMMSERRKHQEEIRDLRQKLDEVVRQQNEIVRSQASSGEQVGKLNEKISTLLFDIDHQAQAQLQAELATRSSQPSGSGQAMPSAHFAPTSNTR
ncbi:related to c-module-binding factor [Sporisorium reilianum SRZ2]|uniref:Related to c-module-binding factor n=1 Tax=Sporisorium reilianum (strain SRZ2) TaxID=999809 RepID=E7A0E4_SPORE|nr:related to c-module-binding factor [Sporisorium reilianum SRZ2]